MAKARRKRRRSPPTARPLRTSNPLILLSLGGQFRASTPQVLGTGEPFQMGIRHQTRGRSPSRDVRELMNRFDREDWDVYQLTRSENLVSAPAPLPIEAYLIARETLTGALTAKRPLASALWTVPVTLATAKLRSHAERRQAIELGLTVWSGPRRSLSGRPTMVLWQSLFDLELPPGTWQAEPSTDRSLQLAGKAVKEIDRKRSWKLAGGPT